MLGINISAIVARSIACNAASYGSARADYTYIVSSAFRIVCVVVLRQAQEDFIKLHKAQLEQFTAAEKEEAGNREKETNRQIDEACLKLKKEFDDQRAAHNEEVGCCEMNRFWPHGHQ